ncbi:hypothetical protein M409DRAFT_17182 [Zasmidium cellare ATCC 36951]|uniref:DUF6594 domain-containing protein n=1 Tax=Zasmidium cellare ATCC 36951 TaxID=1080233 RepID=A0A6A6D1D2_ZASCE|nr:uncharacterized protein M409DRAFT_17182 [Zasmidium cellare ATCC 36951]KAF2173237.1 hypothetical protein M409DRAFT_17182 [Zasmidium cellare ATCC 36951]
MEAPSRPSFDAERTITSSTTTISNPTPSVLEKQPDEPWKTHGYPELTRWMASSNDFLVLRRFSQVGVRLTLKLQDELVRMEEQLRQMDDFASNQPERRGGSGSYRLDEGSPRDKLLEEMAPRLREYYDFVNAFSQIKSRPGAQNFQILHVRNWFDNHHDAIYEPEREFVAEQNDGDLITLVDKPKSLLRQFLQRFTGTVRLFRVRQRADRIRSSTTRYYSDRWFDTFTSAVIIAGGLVMLFVPIWWLNSVVENSKRLGINTGFVFLFAVLLFGATTNATKGFEVLAATAAYAAVLMVYLQNGSSS